MEKKDDASLPGSRARRPPTPTHPPYIEMVQKALMEHGGEEGLTAEEINEYLIAAYYDLPDHDLLFPSYLNLLAHQNKIVRDLSSGRYTIPGRAEVERLKSQAEEVLCKLKKAEDQYIKNLAGPFSKEYHLSKIKKLKALLAEASTSRRPVGFKKPTAGEMSPDPDHGVSGPTAEPKGGERPEPIVNPAGNVSARYLGLHPWRGKAGTYLRPKKNRPNRPDEGPRREAPGSDSGSFKIPKSSHALQSQEGRGGSENQVGISGPAGPRSGPGDLPQAAPGRSADKPGKWIERKYGTITVRVQLPESGSRPSDKLDSRESENDSMNDGSRRSWSPGSTST